MRNGRRLSLVSSSVCRAFRRAERFFIGATNAQHRRHGVVRSVSTGPMLGMRKRPYGLAAQPFTGTSKNPPARTGAALTLSSGGCAPTLRQIKTATPSFRRLLLLPSDLLKLGRYGYGARPPRHAGPALFWRFWDGLHCSGERTGKRRCGLN
jgi:fermentation-respiration switch protein FrsA (DUF1100 family)